MAEITVVGGGSLGLLLAGRIASSGIECRLWTRTELQAALLNRDGLIIQERSGSCTAPIPIHATAIDRVNEPAGPYVLLMVKQTALTPEFLIRLSQVIPERSSVLLFQNGVGHIERIEQALPGRRLITALTTEGAWRVNETTVRHTGQGDIRMGGVFTESDRRVLSLVKRKLIQAGFSVSLSKDLMEAVMQKLLINSIINPLTALLRIRNGELPQSASRLQLMKSLFHESYSILQKYGLRDEAFLWDTILRVCEATSDNESSMLQDLNLHKQTEIDFINGAICQMAMQQGREAPWNTAIIALVKAAH